MNILIPHKWLLEYLDTEASPEEIAKYLSLRGPSVERINYQDNEAIFYIEVTTNRVDMMSVFGIAREAAAILPQFGINAKFKPPILKPAVSVNNPVSLTVKNNPNLCKRIMAAVFDVKLKASNPLIQKRLLQIGMRPLNNIVDITNYVMTEIGHPTHVFDYDKIKNKQLIIRESKKGERAVSFDNKKYILTGGDIVIDDGTGRIIDLPGIIGTKNSVVGPETSKVIFFLETNNHVKIRQTSMRHGIRTVAATLNEKAVDPELAPLAFSKGVEMFSQLLGAKQISNLIDIYPSKAKKTIIRVKHDFLESRIGVKLNPDSVIRILKSLGFKPILKQNTYQVTIPSWRLNDVLIKEGLVEEVARIFGYHNIPSVLPIVKHDIYIFDKKFYWEQKLKEALKYSGFTEVYTYSLIAKNLITKANLNPKNHLKLKNPLSEDWEYLRTGLIPSLLNVYQENENRQADLSLFEMANVYIPRKNKLPKENLMLALTSSQSFLSVKEQLKLVFLQIGAKLRFDKTTNPILAAGFDIYHKEDKIGYIGLPNSLLKQNFLLKKQVCIGELSIVKIVSQAQLKHKYQTISRYNHIIEDLTFEITANTSIAYITKKIKNINKLVNKVIFKGKYKNRISLTIYYLDRTKQLNNKDISPLRKKIVASLALENIHLVGTV